MSQTNQPYVRQYDENGTLLNPIKEFYGHAYPNRAQRRERPQRFRGNHKGESFTILQGVRFRRVVQLEKDKKTGKQKRILHYIPC